MKKILLFLCLILFTTALFAQGELESILHSKDSYEAIVNKANLYFKGKTDIGQLNKNGGEDKDGEYVKFMRWQSYWRRSLTPDGRLGEPAAFWKSKSTELVPFGQSSPYVSVPWTNLSYPNYITGQIGLGRTTSIGFHPTNPNIFYVGAAIGGIWRTTNGGNSYTPLGDDLPFMGVSSIIVNKSNPQNIYIAVSDHVWYGPAGIGVYKSINNGATWQPTALAFEQSEDIRIYWMEADPNNPNKMFVATSNGLYLTNNAFLTVTKINNINTFDVKINPGNSSIVYQGGNNGEFLRSTNAGSSFSPVIDFGNGSVYAAITPLNTSKVYARHGNRLYKSVDNGFSFPSSVTLPESNSVVTFSPTNQNILLTGNFETQRSDNDGASFTATSQWLGESGLPLIHVDQRNIFYNPLQPDFVYYCNDGGVYRYVISSNQFVNLCNGLLITQFYDIAVAQSDAVVTGGGSQDNGNVFRSANGTWDDYAPTGDGMNQEIDPTDANTRYWAYQNGALRRWVNGVNTVISPPGKDGNGAWETPYRLDPTNPGRLIAGYNRVYESLNKGASWTDISGTATFGGNLDEVAISKSNPARIYVARDNQLYVKSTAGNTWTTRNLPGSIGDIEVDPVNTDQIYITVLGYINGSKVFKSTNAGASWINISGSLPNIVTSAVEVYENIPGALFIGTDAGVFYRDDIQTDWQLYGKLPHTRVTDIEIQYAAKLIRVGTHGRGILEAPLVITPCNYGDPDADNDGLCDANDACPNFDNCLNGTPCDDGDPNTTGETYQDCECKGGVSNIVNCAAAGLPGTGGDWIKRVNLNTLDNSSGFSAYTNFKSLSTTLGAGSSYTLKVDLFQSFPLDKVYAWIDFDRDGLFESSELISMSAFDANNQSVGTVNVPAGVGIGATTMRVRSIYADPNTPQPCGNYFGEVEDYTIYFSNCDASGALTTGSDWISRVKLNTIDNPSIQTYYSDYKNLSTNLARGESYPLEVTMNYAFAINDVYAWIDFNQNGIFEVAEQVTMSKPDVSFNSISTGVVSVPANALPGKTIMRIRSQYDDPNAPAPCGSAYPGEVEDYTVNITYCAAKGTPGTGGDYINRVTLNTINNFSGQTGYSNFKNISTNLVRGASYPVQVQAQYAFDIDSVFVWIDYNKNGEFESSEQTIMSKLQPLIFNGKSEGIVQVPISAIQGETVMRVRIKYGSPNNADPCGDYFGEVEDYTVNLTYCGALGASGTTVDWISNVSLNQLDNNSTQSEYSNFTNLSATVYKSNTYQLKLSINYAFPLDTVYAWIDFDRNNSYTANERIMMSNLVANTSNSISTGEIYLPAGVAPGETTIRVRVIYANPNPPDPCNAYFGEVEDYKVVIADNQGGGPCFPDVVLGKELISLATGTYKAGNTLISTSKIINNKVVKMAAGKSILWTPGFVAASGTVVTAEIKPCN